MEFNLAVVNEAVSVAVPDREAIVWRDRRITYGELDERTRRLANHLLREGFAVHAERAELDGWESGQDHLALYLHNGNEYLEGMLGAYKARVAPFNVNYRYVEEELLYLLNDSRAKGVVYHSAFAPTLDAVRRSLPDTHDAAPGRRRLGPRPARRGAVVRRRAGGVVDGAAPGRAVTRRPVHPVHGRHHGHAQRGAVAPGRHLPGGTGRA